MIEMLLNLAGREVRCALIIAYPADGTAWVALIEGEFAGTEILIPMSRLRMP